MSGYWDQLERLLNANRWEDPVDALIAGQYAAAANRSALVELFADHEAEYADEDSEWDSHCQCGKWLERDNYEWPDHMSAVLEDSGLIYPRDQWPEDHS